MSRSFLEEIKQIVLPLVASLYPEAYGITVWEQGQQQIKRKITMNDVYVTLYQLEEKGVFNLQLGGITRERGSRRKHFFTLTHTGIISLQNIQSLGSRLWQSLPLGALHVVGL